METPKEGVIRFGIVGCGRISGFHLEALEALKGIAEVTAVCDVVPERAEAAARKAGGARWYTDLDAMIEAGGLDVLSVCTPSGLHPEHGIAGAQAGLHVVSEKPIGIDLPRVDRLIRTCEERGVRLFTVLQNRLNPTIVALRRALDHGRFGRISLMEVNVFWSRPQEYYDQAPWRGTWALDGGAFMNQASHYVDLAQWFGGEVREVCAFTATLGRRIEAEDTGTAILRFASGALASINVTMLVHPRNLEGSLTILGSRGTARVGGIALNRIDHWEFDSYQDEDRDILASGYTPPTVYGHGHLGYYRNVIEVIRGRAQPSTDGREGRKSLAVIRAIYESAARGGVPVRPDLGQDRADRAPS
ncbi:MAG TPA: Gfo/Idh/MocA family oxidoreductase [Myxococcota bacterium]|nr:Gfo/Idh/MocA family oxidoreductase [Myxococcota bacterium]HQK49932.1 Gfo/Idh/MocA family oxidoreductase [Myxococcota bacterium]